MNGYDVSDEPVHDDKANIRDEIDLSGAEWISTSDTENGVDVASIKGYVAMRKSGDPDNHVLIYTRAEWDAFVAGVKDGEFDVVKSRLLSES